MKKISNNQATVRSPLIDMISESFQLMEAYINQDRDCEIIIDGQSVNQHRMGPPNYGDILQTIEATDEHFRQLSSLKIPKERFDELIRVYETLRLNCEKFWESKK